MSKTIDVDTKTFVRFWMVILGFVLVALFIWKALTALIIIGIAAFLAIAIQPLAQKLDKLDRKKKRPVLTSVLAYVLLIGALGLIIGLVGPMVIDQTVQFLQQLPTTFQNSIGGWDAINHFGESIGITNFQGEILTAIQSFSSSVVGDLSNTVVAGVGTIASIITNVVLVLVLTLLFTLEGPAIINDFWKTLAGKRDNKEISAYRRLADRMVETIQIYVSKQMTVALLDGVMTIIAVLILSAIFGFSGGLAFPLGLIAMTLYLIPMFGPIIACILMALLLFFSSPAAAVIFVIFYIVYQQIENNFIAPKIQGDALNLPASVILIAITIGMYMFGLIGALVSIPIAGCIKVIFEEIPNLRELHSDKE